MTAPLRYPAQAAIEDLAGVPRIEELHAERDSLVALNSRVKSLKHNDLWKTLRDIELAKAAAKVREAWTEDKPPSEAHVTSVAHTDPTFIAWVQQMDAMFAAYETVEDRINALNELVNRGQALIRYVSNAPRN